MTILENQQAAEPIDLLYQDLEEVLMRNIIRHLRDYEQPIDSDEWLMKKLAEIGKLNQENLQLIARYSGISQTAALRMLEAVSESVLAEVEPCFRHVVRDGLADLAVTAEKSRNMRRVMKGLQKQAKETLNLCNTTMLYKARDAYRELVQVTAEKAQEYIDLMNQGAAEVVTGAQSRQQVLRQTIRRFNDKGIPAFVDRAGRNWTPEAYVNMAMRTTARNVADQVQEARCRDYGITLVQIDSHSGARPKCAKDQGKIFDLNNGEGETTDLRGKKIHYYPWNSSSYGEPDGILGINCGHHRWPFIPGVNARRYFPTEDMEENDRLYRQTQNQRALERDVRRQKRECMLFDELGDDEAFMQASEKLKEKEQILSSYVEKHEDLHRRKDREQVVGFDKRIAAKAVSAGKNKGGE